MSDTSNANAQLTIKILIAMVAGASIGLLINQFYHPQWVNDYLVNGLFMVVGKVFVGALKMLVVPLVFVSLIGGVTALGDPAALGRIGGKSIVMYLLTTALAISVALLLATLVAPGSGGNLIPPEAGAFAATAPPSLAQVLINMVPTNPIAALAKGEMLQIIVFSIILGVAIMLAGEAGKPLLSFFETLNAVVMQMVSIVMKLAPYGVFCLLAKTMSVLGLDSIGNLAAYFFTVIAALLIHATINYSLLVTLLARLNPIKFLAKMRPVLIFAFSTASSNATIPITLRTVRNRLGVDNRIASFTVPLGATINMDGTAIMQGVATVFIANLYGITLGFGDFMTVIITATLASIGTAGVPGVGLIMLAMVLAQVGLPVEGIAMIIGIDRLLDMLRTAVNVTGDAAVTCVVARSEKAIDTDVFNDPNAPFEADSNPVKAS